MTGIVNKKLEKYVKAQLNKYNDLTKEDLNQVTRILIDQLDINGNYNEIDLKDITLFTNLESLNLRNIDIEDAWYDTYIQNLNLKTLELYNCTFNALTYFPNIETLVLSNCQYIDINEIQKYATLKKLILLNAEISDDIFKGLTLEHLDIRNSKISDYEFLNNLTKLRLYIDQEQYMNNMEVVNSLKEKEVTLYVDERYVFGSEVTEDDI